MDTGLHKQPGYSFLMAAKYKWLSQYNTDESLVYVYSLAETLKLPSVILQEAVL